MLQNRTDSEPWACYKRTLEATLLTLGLAVVAATGRNS